MHQLHPRYAIDRPAYSQPDFDEEFNRKRRNYPLGDKVRKIFRCSSGRLKSLLFRHLPVLSWLPKYNFKQNLVCDVISGVSAGTIQSVSLFLMSKLVVTVDKKNSLRWNKRNQTQGLDYEAKNEHGRRISLANVDETAGVSDLNMTGNKDMTILIFSLLVFYMVDVHTWMHSLCMAFALLANLPPVNGLYSSFFPLIPYFFMGTAHQMVPGTFAVLSIMVGIVCLQLAPESDYSYFNTTHNATVVNEQKMNEARLVISGTLACLTAIIQIGLGMMQFGFVAIYLSDSFVRGFMTAAGLQILISVLKYIFGITVPPYSGPLAVIYTLIDICKGLPRTNVASLVFSLISCVVLIIVKELSTRYRHKIPYPIPIEIIVVVMATAISGPLHLPEKYHMDIVGEIPLGFPAPILPIVLDWGEMLSTAFSLAIVGYVINLAMGRTLASKHGYDVDPNQEMLALGFSNLLGGFFKIHVICCALSVTLAVDSAGGSSQFASLCVMVVVMVTMLALGAFLRPLPKSVLGALIAVNLKNTLLQISDPYYLWKKSKLDCCVWVVSFLATFFLSLPFGVAIGVSFSILVVIFQTQFRNGSEVVQVLETDLYKNPKVYSKVKSTDGVKIVSYCSPLYFANAEIFRRKVIKKTGLDPGKVLLARKKFMKKQQEKEKQELKAKQNEEKAAAKKRNRSSLVTFKAQTISQIDLQSDFYTISNNMPTSYINPYCDIINPTDQSPTELPEPVPASSPTIMMEMQPVPFHTLILDLGGVCFIDLMGIKVLTKMSNNYSMLGISLYVANVQAQVFEELEAGGVFEASSITPSHMFLSVHDAVLFAQQKSMISGTVEEQEDMERVKLAFDVGEEEHDLEQELF